MKKLNYLLLSILVFQLYSCSENERMHISGDLMTWHKLTFDITGPTLCESDVSNPFLDYRVNMEFRCGEKKYIVPGYFAADGNAAETGATKGNIWRVHFSPDIAGEWTYTVSFEKGNALAVKSNEIVGEKLSADGMTGMFEVSETDKTGTDFRGKGRLMVSDKRYLQHAGSGEFFLKGGTDSPENLLGYKDFDGTYYGGSNMRRSGEDAPNEGLHSYEPHLEDWTSGDPSWQEGKGKSIIGGMNYLSSKGVNSAYFLTMNIQGDGDDVWPYTDRNERYRFDCSKLDQWEILFSHMESKGIMMHVVLQETENENILDGGFLDVQRKLYLRELVARFSHHNAITWNLGEEHGPVEWIAYGQTAEHTMQMASYLREADPYGHFIVVHTHPNEKQREAYISEFLNCPNINGPSIQSGDPLNAHHTTLKWIESSEKRAYPWIVCIDEIGPHWQGAMDDASDPDHDTIRKHVLWANLMAGGAGVEWYFGYKYPHGDLNCEDWRSRDLLWDQTRNAIEFFIEYLPFQDMISADHLVNNAYCFAKEGDVYAVYNYGQDISKINLRDQQGRFRVRWYNPKNGGALIEGNIMQISGGKLVDPGLPEGYILGDDWVYLLTRNQDE